jgi:hypothetical protein
MVRLPNHSTISRSYWKSVLDAAKKLDPPALKGYLEHTKLAQQQIADLKAQLANLEGMFATPEMEAQILSVLD